MTQDKKPTLIVIAGPNGSGKTSITEALLGHEWFQGCEYINPDNIAKHVFGDWNSTEASIKAANQAHDLRERLLAEKKSFVFETVMSTTEKVDFIQKAKDAGYFVRLFYIGTDTPTINAARVAKRVMSGGHAVPIDKIISRYSKANENCIAAMHIVDRGYVYDNSVDGDLPRLMFKVSDGYCKRYSEVNEWASRISSSFPSIPKSKP